MNRPDRTARRRAAALAVALSVATALPVLAQDGPVGVAFVQGEEGTWWCHGPSVGAAVDCARQQCLSSAGEPCVPTRWCQPAGWSALMVTWLPEFHATHILCGMPGAEASRAAARAICETGAEFSRCDLVLHIDPTGIETPVEDASWAGGAALATERTRGD